MVFANYIMGANGGYEPPHRHIEGATALGLVRDKTHTSTALASFCNTNIDSGAR